MKGWEVLSLIVIIECFRIFVYFVEIVLLVLVIVKFLRLILFMKNKLIILFIGIL